MIYMILYIPLVFPGSWILDKLVSRKLFIVVEVMLDMMFA